MVFHIRSLTLAAIFMVFALNSAHIPDKSGSYSMHAQSGDIGSKARSKVRCSSGSKQSPYPQCANEEFRIKGKPSMLPPFKGVAFGVSVSPTDPTDIFVWMDNQTDDAHSYLNACNVSFLKDFVLYDSTGRRLLTTTEAKSQKGSPDQVEVEECACCILSTVAPHTIQVVDQGNLRSAYALLPGQYLVVPVDPRNGITVVIPDKK